MPRRQANPKKGHVSPRQQRSAAQGQRSLAVRSKYKTWLTGVVDCLNRIHHYRHKNKFTQVTNR